MKQKMEWIAEQARWVADVATELGGTSGYEVEAVDHLAAILQIRERVAACLEMVEDPAEDERRRLAAHRAAERNMCEAWRRLAWAGVACARCAAWHARDRGPIAWPFDRVDRILAQVEKLARISRDAPAFDQEQACREIVNLLAV